MNSSKRNAIIILVLLLAAAIVYIYSMFSFDVRSLRYPDVVESPALNTKVKMGSTFTLTLNDENLKKADSTVVTLNDKPISKTADGFKFDIDTKALPLGNYHIDIKIYNGNKSKTIDVPFNVVSDITPSPMTYRKLSVIPHDSKSYTQGLEISDGILYESGGQYKESLVRKVNPLTGQVIKNVALANEVFAEGLTVLNDKVYQITWQEGICYIYDKDLNQLNKTGFRSTNDQGWGLTNDGKSLIVSDGSHKLTFLNPENMAVEKVVSVYGGENEATYINELEYVDGYIYANIYTTDQIAKIEASSGKIISVADMSALKAENQDGEVLNGIAYLPNKKTFLVTGKYWKNMYEIQFD